MQYHLNGWNAGDPSVATNRQDALPVQPVLALPAKVDVLIVGCGPAGLTLAAQLAQFEKISVCIVDQKTGPLLVGQADGIACRSVEMMQAYGFADRVLKEAYWVNETAFWKPQENNSGHIVRHDKVQDTEDGLSEFPHVILNQARVHDFFLEVMRNSVTALEPHYGRSLDSLVVDEELALSQSSYPVRATFLSASNEQHSATQPGVTEMVRARYVVGCDGARSTVRESIGLELKGDSANHAWGVMDILAVTDFPDVRLKNLIQSDTGSIVLIPREGGYMFRLYVELGKLDKDERIAGKKVTVEALVAKAQKIFNPYTLDIKEIAWWSVYQIGQRLCDKFDDVPMGQSATRSPHVFIAGDACHTHSPKAGQGMNVSMRDSFNLGWKLANVILGRSSTKLLHTYSAERQAVAKELIEFDQEWSTLISSTSGKVVLDAETSADAGSSANASTDAGSSANADTEPGAIGESNEPSVDPKEFQRYFVKHARYTAGTAIQYAASIISADSPFQHLARGFDIGTRIHSAPVIRLADAKPVHLGHTLSADGRWRLYLFADTINPIDKSSLLNKLCTYLQNEKSSPLLRYTPADEDIDSVFDIRAVFQQTHRSIQITDVPALLFPEKGRYGLRDYEKCFCVDRRPEHNIYKLRGINTETGCVVVVRPDQHVAHVLPLDAFEELSLFFDAFMCSKD